MPIHSEPFSPRGRWLSETVTGIKTRSSCSGEAEEIAYTALFFGKHESSYITGTDIVVDGGWFSSAPCLGNKKSHHMLSLSKKKDELHEKKEEVGLPGELGSQVSRARGRRI